MTCQEVADFLMDYLNRDLSPRQRTVFEEHLGVCPDCVAYLRSYEITIHASKNACGHDQCRRAQNAPEDLIRAILAARGTP